jgi:hypothetical protein
MNEVNNSYAEFIKNVGILTITVNGTDWYNYRKFMVPAYLPHCVPLISRETAYEVLKKSGNLFVRWDENFSEMIDSQWWYILRKAPWDIADIKDKKKRWMVKRGEKAFNVRPLGFDEVIRFCPVTAKAAATRYKGQKDVETKEILESRVAAALKVPGVLEYLGCFYKGKMAAYAENYIQANAVWLAVIRYDPEYLSMYSSYGFLNGILNYYLNERKMSFVLDGCRSIHHKTNFQEHLIRVFGFTKEYARLNILYSPAFGKTVKCAYPFRNFFWKGSEYLNNSILDNVSAVLRQEQIRRSCGT